MPRLYRPHIPLEVRCRVALRQLGEMWPDAYLTFHRDAGLSFQQILDDLLERLRDIMHAEELHLDHDPPLAAREKQDHWKGDDVLGLNRFSVYVPAANDPEYLIYREKAAHGIKTRVRGEHGQYSDLALIKRKRRRERGPKPKKRFASKGFAKKSSKMANLKQRIPSRPFPKRRKP